MNRKKLIYYKIWNKNQKKFININQFNKSRLISLKLMKEWIYQKCINYDDGINNFKFKELIIV